MKTLILQISVVLVLFTACNDSGKASKLKSEEETNASIIIKTSLQKYLDALISGEKETISKYFYKDALKNLRKYTSYDFTIDEFITENLISPVLEVKKIYDEKGVKHYYSIEDEINHMVIKGYSIYSFLVSENLVLRGNSLRDTIRVLAFQKDNILEFLTVSEGIEDILSYKFTKIEVQNILNKTFEGKYDDFLRDLNDKIFKEYEWRLEAVGPDMDKLFEYTAKIKEQMLSEELDEIPEKMKFSKSRNKLEMISLIGEKRLVNYSLNLKTINLPFDGRIYNLTYTITSSGLVVYYFDLHMIENNQGVILTYKGYEKKAEE